MIISDKDRSLIERSGLFQTKWYLDQYPDVQLLDMDAIEHYVWLGSRLRRNPSPQFNTAHYYRQYPDIEPSGINPLLHYLTWGEREGRLPNKPAPDQYGHYFDPTYYRAQAGLATDTDADLLAHFNSIGWRQGLNPSRFFDTKYYIENNSDIAEAGINPLEHYIAAGRLEGRRPLPFQSILEGIDYRPLVSVIIPNFNHARYLRQRIDSVLNQSYDNIEVIILDDCSSDNSREVIGQYLDGEDSRVSFYPNDQNSGNVFKQWQKGIELSQGELVWICESDDFCEHDFLSQIVPKFRDQSTMMAFGAIQFCDENGSLRSGLDNYRENALPGGWINDNIRLAAEWFGDAFAISNIIPNVGGCVFRNQTISDDVWKDLRNYQILGDWRLYLELSGGGQIAFVRDAVAYFRQHSSNTSVKSFTSAAYYQEHASIMRAIRNRWQPSEVAVAQFIRNVEFQYDRVNASACIGPLSKHFSEDLIQPDGSRVPHILILILGFSLGGGEIFPIHLSNELVSRGYRVSIAVLNYDHRPNEIRKRLDRRVPVFDLQNILERSGFADFVRRAGVDLVHSHCVDMDHYVFNRYSEECPVPYLVTNHGSYECTALPRPMLDNIIRNVDHWIYLTAKNLGHLGDADAETKTTQLVNGMPVWRGESELSRDSLNIPSDAVIFALASRAIREKGWEEAILAADRLRSRTSQSIFLLICGDGPELGPLSEKYGDRPWLKFLGLRSDVAAIYGLGDCALLPTRFAGESYPLTLIEAMQMGTPIISSTIGHIPEIVGTGRRSAGILIDASLPNETFIDALSTAMEEMLDPMRRRSKAATALSKGEKYSMSAVGDAHVAVYQKLRGDFDWKRLNGNFPRGRSDKLQKLNPSTF